MCFVSFYFAWRILGKTFAGEFMADTCYGISELLSIGRGLPLRINPQYILINRWMFGKCVMNKRWRLRVKSKHFPIFHTTESNRRQNCGNSLVSKNVEFHFTWKLPSQKGNTDLLVILGEISIIVAQGGLKNKRSDLHCDWAVERLCKTAWYFPLDSWVRNWLMYPNDDQYALQSRVALCIPQIESLRTPTKWWEYIFSFCTRSWLAGWTNALHCYI